MSRRVGTRRREVAIAGIETEVLRLGGGSGDRPLLERAARLLVEGGLVAFPTETVYALGADADRPEAVKRLIEVKERPPEQAFTVLVAEVEAVRDLVAPEALTPMARRLMERCWPGPLTLVFARGLRTDGSLGLRLPDHPVARELIRLADCPVLAPSANVSGHPPALTAREVLDVFDGKIEAVVDGGPARLATPSTVVRLTEDGYEVLREGAISARQLRRLMNRSILFVCSGNSCRSPLAEGLCRSMLSQRLGVEPGQLSEHGYEVTSAGTDVRAPTPASYQAGTVAAEMGVDLSAHLSQPLTDRMLRAADVVYVMTPEQMGRVLELAPWMTGKVMLLDQAGRPVADPHGGDLETYRRCATQVQQALRKRIERL